MSNPDQALEVYKMTRVDHAVMNFAKIDKPSINDILAVKCVAQVEEGIDYYRACAAEMSNSDLKKEEHNSARLAKHMESSGDPRPASAELCHCHAIVSGAHKLAAQQRAIMAWCMMRIDDPRNGCWLPRNTAAKARMPRWLRNAVPHSRIHRKSYYFWLDQLININTIKSTEDLLQTMKVIRTRLQSSSLPIQMKREMNI